MAESLVDLLLVRLGRDEEKRKVLKLLITSLDLSMSDAENAVENSPSVIREAVPMTEARLIQKDLYPYIDLLPRFDDEADQTEETSGEDLADISRPSVSDDIEDDIDDEEDDYYQDDSESDNARVIDDEIPGEDYQSHDDDHTGEDEGPVIITSARDEIRVTTRCHICGRTPVDGERLAPCRTCGDLTCRECFDRVAHVCNKCAASGKSIEHANDGVEKTDEQGLVFDSDVDKTAPEKGKSSIGKYLGITALVIVLLAAGFYFLDPMNLFGAEETVSNGTDAALPDSTEEVQPDTTEIAAEPDSLELIEVIEEPVAVPDTISGFDDPFATRRLELSEEYSAIENPPIIRFRSSVPRSVNARVLTQESDLITRQLSTIAAWIPVELDDAVLLEYHDTTSVLVLVLTHPEETETRMALMRLTADWLQPSNIDQLVLIYRENRFQNVVSWSLVSEVFPDVQGVLSPSLFQDYLSYREDCWESLSGPVTDWLTDI